MDETLISGWLSSAANPPVRHMTQFFLTGGYRFHLIDVLEGLADADPRLIRETWVREAVDAVDALAVKGRIPLAKNYSNELIDPLISIITTVAHFGVLRVRWISMSSGRIRIGCSQLVRSMALINDCGTSIFAMESPNSYGLVC